MKLSGINKRRNKRYHSFINKKASKNKNALKNKLKLLSQVTALKTILKVTINYYLVRESRNILVSLHNKTLLSQNDKIVSFKKNS